MNKETNHQCPELNSNDIKIRIEGGRNRWWIQEENVRPVVGSSRGVFGTLFLQEEHLKTRESFEFILIGDEFSSHDSS